MKINEDIYNEFNSKIYNQDNNGVWVHPVVQKPWFKIYVLGIFIILGRGFLEGFNIKNITKVHIVFYLANLILVLIATIYYISNKIKINKFIKIQNEKNKEQFEMNFEYYREILNEFSPGVLAFCYNKNLKYADIIISTLLSFNNKYIKLDIQNKVIQILADKDYSSLKEHEKYLLKNIEQTSTNITFEKLKEIITDTYFKSNFLNLIKQDCKNSNYFQTVHRMSNFLLYIFLFYGFIYAFFAYRIFIYILIMLGNFDLHLFFVYVITLFYLILLMTWDRKNTYMKTTKGYELNIKLNGLKKYFLDYSTIKDRSIKDITIWEYYIIYAIILDLKGNLDKEVLNFYKEIS